MSPIEMYHRFRTWELLPVLLPVLLTAPSLPGNLFATEKSYESSLVCESCHSNIYHEWERSFHAVSWEDSLFQDLYAAVKSREEDVKCLSCHAPVAWNSGDTKVMKGISREGVNCDYCHSLSVLRERSGITEFQSRPGNDKVGRTGRGESIYHGIKEEDGFGTADYCATCHHLRNEYGVLIYSDYESWKENRSRTAGKSCRDCHMPESTARASNYGKVRGDVSSHRFSGGHRAEMLQKACTFSATLTVSSDSVNVRTTISNNGSGHKLPGGSPLRELVVSIVGLDGDGRELFEDVGFRLGVEFEMADDDSVDIWNARSILKDDRIDPGGKRTGISKVPLLENLDRLEVTLLCYPIPLRMVEEKELETEPIEIHKKVLDVN